MDDDLISYKTSKEEEMDDYTLIEEISGGDWSFRSCSYCAEEILVPFYTRSGKRGKTCYIHKACADLPLEMEHKEEHPEHTLVRVEIPRDREFPSPRCSICGHYLVFRMVYLCSVCPDFVMDIKCALKCFPVSHKCHQHPLIPIHSNEFFNCVACRRDGVELSYRCQTCPSFTVHQQCVSSQTVHLPSHRHGLKVIYSLPHNRSGKPISCETCGEEMDPQTYAYHCSRCRYFVHIHNCRPVIHFSHEDPLVLVEERFNPDSTSGNCFGCGLEISAPYYYCPDRYCLGFFVHKCCAELPESMEHHLHPEHSLTLSILGKEKKQYCTVCLTPWEGFAYSCATCVFTLDIVCAMKTLHLKHIFHKHRMIASQKKGSFSCHACNIGSEGTAYQCTTCRFWVHQHCASLAMFRTYDMHPHKLKLTFSLPDSLLGDSKQFNCDDCREEIHPHNWAYHCAGCKYFTHIHTCSDYRDTEGFDYEAALAASINIPSANDCVSLATLFLKDTSQKKDEEESEASSQNTNALRTRRIPYLDPNETCSKCIEFLAAPCNKCALCRYFLPKSSSELQDPSLFKGYYSMLKDSEENNCNGFAMKFTKGMLYMKISASVLPRYVKHEGHIHVLSSTFLTKKTWCSACKLDFQGYGFKCTICRFILDSYCALLPGSVSHSYDKEHGFNLTYYSIEDVEEYVCEICEGDIKTMWFYHCEKCDQSIHPRCIWKIYIMFGPFITDSSDEKYDDDEVTLVPGTTSLAYTCVTCYEKETSGCHYSLFSAHGDSALHLQCISNSTLKRWPREEAALQRKVAMLRSEEEHLNPQSETC